jgi:hypothetical protein
MNKNNTATSVLLMLLINYLSSCTMYDESEYINYAPYPSEDYARYTQYSYPRSSNIEIYQSRKQVVVPESYHVGQFHSPMPVKDMDKSWVSNQNPNGYTIELADDAEASVVAQKLYKAPKNQRMGQVPYQRNGKRYYKGLYGSYESPEAAKKALDGLPQDLKDKAGVKSWGSVQGGME